MAFGDCAVTTNITGMRNPIGAKALLDRAYVETATRNPGPPTSVVPKHLPKALPVHKVVDVDVFLPGCPPSADLIHATVLGLLTGRPPEELASGRFGK